MTDELLREDAYLKSCEARVVEAGADGVVLDRTVFYPEGGGQPGDRGELVGADRRRFVVLDCHKRDDGSLVHQLEAGSALPAVDDVVTATLDWDYRYRHMRTHTCLHLMCALIPFPVTGGSISQDKGRLDFDMTDGVDKPALEAKLNELVKNDHAVGFRWITDEEMSANMDLVRTMSVTPPMGQGRVRLIDVAGVDLQPCGGTHVKRTSEIGVVRVGKVEKKGKHNRRVSLHLD